MRDLSVSRSQLLLLAGTANRPLAEEMAQHLGQPLCAVTMRRFADGEIFVKIDENVRGRDVFIIQPTNPPAENYLELLLLMDAARRASAARITAVLPYFGYARQDRKDQPRVAISAKLMANLVTNAVRHARGTDAVEVNLHATRTWLRIEIQDTDRRWPRPRIPDGSDESGFGLVLVDALAAKWGVRETEAGKAVWAELDTGQGPAPRT